MLHLLWCVMPLLFGYADDASSVLKILQCRGVCGFPTIVHGGLTATVMDETLGFLLFALKKQKALPFWGPAYTAHLEVDYKSVRARLAWHVSSRMPSDSAVASCRSETHRCYSAPVNALSMPPQPIHLSVSG